MKVVVDTNVFVVARFKKEGARKRLIQDCIDGAVEALYVPTMEEEAKRVLDKVGASPVFMARVYRFFGSATLVEGCVDLNVCEDPADNMFVECAVSGGADYIISEDRHLRALEGYNGIRVRSAAEFYQESGIPKRRG